MPDQGQYAHPPVVEALCEVHFVEAAWDETVPGRFYDRVAKLGFEQKEPIEMHEANLVIDGPEGPSATLRQRTRMRFANADRTRLIQVEPNLVVLNQLRPYPKFETWAPVTIAVAEEFAQLTGGSPVGRIGMRYINHIALPGKRVDLDDWFTVAPKLPISWQDEVGSFLVRAQRLITERMSLVLTFGSAPSREGDSAFLLDLYAETAAQPAVPASSIARLLDEAHASIEEAFEGSITQALRDRFHAVNKE